MLELHGIPVSNYYNMVKHALLEKGADFKEVANPPSQEPGFKAKGPMGKVPFLMTEHGPLSETSAILEYVEEILPKPALLPSDPYARAKVREISRVLELYIELSARRHFGHVFFKGPKSDAAVEEARPVIENALGAVAQLATFGPYLCGSEFTYADIVAHNTFGYAGMVGQAIYGWDLVAEVPGLAESLAATNARESTKRVDADQAEALKALSG